MSANKPSSRTHRTRPDSELNLTPMIDMITCLMFFLLVLASMLPVVIIDAPLPKIAASAEEVKQAKDTKNKMEVMVWINAQGFKVKSDVGGEKSFAVDKEGKFPGADLHKFLVELKAKRPDTREITLMPADDTPYFVMIEVIDASRDLRKEDKGYQELPPDIYGKPEAEQFNRLFPDVSIGGV